MNGIYRGKRTLGLITARGGSRSIPRKNIKKLLGKPLIAYTIETAIASRYLTRFIVSTDNPKIASISKQYGAEVPFFRPKSLARDTTPSLDVAIHALSWLKKHEGESYDYLMILQPTSPLRSADDIDECIRTIIATRADSVMSMVELPDFHPQKIKKIQKGVILSAFENEGRSTLRRQDVGHFYKRNCAIYLTKVSCILREELFGKISRAYIMPRERSIDINDPVDFDLAEFWLKSQA